MTVTRRGVASVLVTLLFLGCAAGPKSAETAPEAGAAAERGRPVPAERPADPVAYLHVVRAHYYAEAAEWAEAVTELRRALDRDSRTPALWHQLARWLGRQGAHAEAVAAAKRALALDPGRAAVYLTLAEAYHALKNEAEATTALEQAIRLNPQATDAYETLARYAAEVSGHGMALMWSKDEPELRETLAQSFIWGLDSI